MSCQRVLPGVVRGYPAIQYTAAVHIQKPGLPRRFISVSRSRLTLSEEISLSLSEEKRLSLSKDMLLSLSSESRPTLCSASCPPLCSASRPLLCSASHLPLCSESYPSLRSENRPPHRSPRRIYPNGRISGRRFAILRSRPTTAFPALRTIFCETRERTQSRGPQNRWPSPEFCGYPPIFRRPPSAGR